MHYGFFRCGTLEGGIQPPWGGLIFFSSILQKKSYIPLLWSLVSWNIGYWSMVMLWRKNLMHLFVGIESVEYLGVLSPFYIVLSMSIQTHWYHRHCSRTNIKLLAGLFLILKFRLNEIYFAVIISQIPDFIFSEIFHRSSPDTSIQV